MMLPMKASVILTVRNGSRELPEQLESLAAQHYTGSWELLVVDHGSTDHTVEVAMAFASRLPIRIIDAAAEPGAAAARNLGATAATGELLLFCDHDDVLDQHWIEEMVAALERYPAVGGALELDQLNGAVYPLLHRGTWSELPRVEGYLAASPTANFAAWASAFWAVGGFDTAYAVSYDVDISIRLQQAGFELGFAPAAVVHYRDRRSLAALTKQRYRYGLERPLLYRRLRDNGFPRTPVGPGVLGLLRLPFLAVRAAPSCPGRRWFLRTAAQRVGRLAGSIRYRALYL